jgi:hypothetical protein
MSYTRPMSENELATASRDELLPSLRQLAMVNEQLAAVNEQQKTLIGALQARLSTLEHKRAGRSGPGMPGPTPPRTPPPPPTQPRTQRGRGFGRPRLPPTETVDQVVETCPAGGTPRAGGWVQATREVLEVPLGPGRVSAPQDRARRWPRWEKRQMPPVALDGLVLDAQQRGGSGG